MGPGWVYGLYLELLRRERAHGRGEAQGYQPERAATALTRVRLLDWSDPQWWMDREGK